MAALDAAARVQQETDDLAPALRATFKSPRGKPLASPAAAAATCVAANAASRVGLAERPLDEVTPSLPGLMRELGPGCATSPRQLRDLQAQCRALREADVAERAGVLSDSTEAVAGLWYLVPVVCGLALVGVAARSVRLVTLTAGTIGLTVVAGGMLVARSPLGAEPGLFLATGLGVVAIASGIGTQIISKRRST